MSRSTTRAVLFATLASVQATAATASDMSAVSSDRWCYRQMQDSWIHTMILAPGGKLRTERYDGGLNRVAHYEGTWAINDRGVLSLSFEIGFQSGGTVSMDPSGQRFTYKATRQARPQTMTMVAYDTTILP